MKYFIPLLLTGCAASFAPPEVESAWEYSRDNVLYSLRLDDLDVWTGDCPEVGTCVEQSLCAIGQLRRAGKPAYMSWCDTPDPDSDHVIATSGEWHIDWNVSNTPPCNITGQCHQLTFPQGKISTVGTWLCSWNDGGYAAYNVKGK